MASTIIVRTSSTSPDTRKTESSLTPPTRSSLETGWSVAPTLVVLNACHTAEGLERIQEVAAVVIATTDSVGDASSAIFSTHFYGAIAAAQTIGDAVRQARAIISLALPDEGDLLVVSAAEGINPDMLQLVRPIV
jgi:hypothetical protein